VIKSFIAENNGTQMMKQSSFSVIYSCCTELLIGRRNY